MDECIRANVWVIPTIGVLASLLIFMVGLYLIREWRA
jgi:hypothetical protein